MSRILDLLALKPSRESIDYVENKQQFHLHSLVTEQRHPATWSLGLTFRSDTAAGLRSILSVDEDVARIIAELASNPSVLEQAVQAVVDAVRNDRRVYVYGCGATGRLAKQMESTFWRPFWRSIERSDCWQRLKGRLSADVAEALVGEMTGADRALVSSLEGFEDLMLLGDLQLRDHGIAREDVVFCVTEGGETSSVIGTVLAALEQYGDLDEERCAEARRNLYFVYNNPDEVLRPFDRSRAVLENPAITRLCLATGPQAVAGSTRMQATTIETFVIGVILEEAIFQLLREHLSAEQLAELGFSGDVGISARLKSFDRVKAAADRAVGELARLTELEAAAYERGGYATYFARRAMVTVFTDCTERSPTFRLFPLDKVKSPQRCSWVQVWTDGADASDAWRNFLGRPFRGLDPAFYRAPLEERVEDPYLKKAALSSLNEAGNDQESLYDFSFSKSNVEGRGPKPGDIGVLVLVDDELNALERPGSDVFRFRSLHRERRARLAVIHVSTEERGTPASRDGDRARRGEDGGQLDVRLNVDAAGDPLALRQQTALKILLNAHSTGVMARMGRVVGNTMTNVSPSNLKLIGRATFLVMSHVNDVLEQPAWREQHGTSEPITYAEANAVVFDAMSWVASQGVGQTAEVGLSVVRILESLKRSNVPVSWEEAREILEKEELATFLLRCNPTLDVR